jgi:hypothetical protein
MNLRKVRKQFPSQLHILIIWIGAEAQLHLAVPAISNGKANAIGEMPTMFRWVRAHNTQFSLGG